LEKLGHGKRVPDLTRGRFVMKNIKDVEKAATAIIHAVDLLVVGIWNLFLEKKWNPYETDFKAFVMAFITSYKEDFTKFSTELQFLTEASNAMANLNHPYDLAKVLEYDIAEDKEFVEILMKKVAIYDYFKFKLL